MLFKNFVLYLYTFQASDNGYQIMISEDGEDEAVEGIYSEPTSNFTSHSPSVSSPASDSPTPTNSGGALEKRWNEPLNAQWHIIGKCVYKVVKLPAQ